MFESNSFNKENNHVISVTINQNDIKTLENHSLKHFSVYTADKNLRFIIFSKHWLFHDYLKFIKFNKYSENSTAMLKKLKKKFINLNIMLENNFQSKIKNQHFAFLIIQFI